jgi:hypothetical protein
VKCIFEGIPLDLAKQYAEEYFPREVNDERIRRVNMRTVTEHEEEYYEEETSNNSFHAGMSGETENYGETSGSSVKRGTHFVPRSRQEVGSYDVWTREEKIGKLAQRFMRIGTGTCNVLLPNDVFRLEVPFMKRYLPNPASLVKFLHTLRSNSISKHEADEIIKREAARFAERSRHAGNRPKPKKGPANLHPQS